LTEKGDTKAHLVLGLLGGLNSEHLLALEQAHLGLEAHNTSTPPLEYFSVLGVLRLERISEALEGVAILRVDGGESNNGGVLLVDEGSETATALHDAVRDTHALAKGGEEDNKFDGVNIVGDDDKLGLLLLNEVGHVLEAVLENGGGVASSGGTGSLGATSFLDALLLGGSSLGGVLAKKLEKLNSLVLGKGVLELVDDRGHLKTLLKDLLLALDAHVLGPADETAKVLLVL